MIYFEHLFKSEILILSYNM